jgi:hypothetical protein
MKFFRHLFGITKLDKEKNQCIRKKNRSTEYSKGNKTVPGKVASTRRYRGWTQMEHQNKRYNINQKEEGT